MLICTNNVINNNELYYSITINNIRRCPHILVMKLKDQRPILNSKKPFVSADEMILITFHV